MEIQSTFMSGCLHFSTSHPLSSHLIFMLHNFSYTHTRSLQQHVRQLESHALRSRPL